MERKKHIAPKYDYEACGSASRPVSYPRHAISSPLRRNINIVHLWKRTRLTPRPLSTDGQLALELFIYLSEYTKAEPYEIASTLKAIFPRLESDDWADLSTIDENWSDSVKNVYEAEDDIEVEDLWTRITSHPDETLFQRLQNLVERIESEDLYTRFNLTVSIEKQEWMLYRGVDIAPLPFRAKRYDGPAVVRRADIPLDDAAEMAAIDAYMEEFKAAEAKSAQIAAARAAEIAGAETGAVEASRNEEESDQALLRAEQYVTSLFSEPTGEGGVNLPMLEYDNHEIYRTPPSSPQVESTSLTGISSFSSLPHLKLISPAMRPQSLEEEQSQIEAAIAASIRDMNHTPVSASEAINISCGRSALQPVKNQGHGHLGRPGFGRPPKLTVRNPDPTPLPQGPKGLCIIFEDPENEPDVDHYLVEEARCLASQRREKEREIEIYTTSKEDFEEQQLRDNEAKEQEDLERAMRMSLGFE